MVKQTLKKLYKDYENESELAKRNVIKTKIFLLEGRLTYEDIVDWINENSSYEIGFLRNEEDYNDFVEGFNMQKSEGITEAEEFIDDVLNDNLKTNSYYNDKDKLFYVNNPCVGYDLYNIYDIHNGLYKMLYYILDDWGLHIRPKEYNDFLKLFY